MKPRQNWKTTLRLVAIAVILLADAIFVAQNYVAVELRFLWWRWDTHLSWVPVVLLLPGIAAGWLWFGTRRRSSKWRQAEPDLS
jgi:uncharacterized integral membrane protein